MTLKPCLTCGEPSAATRCTAHGGEHSHVTSPRSRGYDTQWDRLSRRARALQPWCSGCGATEDLQADHTPEAWERRAAGKAVRLNDIQILCRLCNLAAGAARGKFAGRRAPRADEGGAPGSDGPGLTA